MFQDYKLDKGIQNLSKKIGLSENFFLELLEEDDWSFIIKLHALLENVCTSLLVFHFNDENLKEIFSRLELSNTTTGKLAFLKATKLIGSENRRFIVSLSQLRNILVHDVSNYKINLKQHVGKLEKEKLKNFVVSFSPYETLGRKFMKGPLYDPKKNKSWYEQCKIENITKRAIQNPKTFIWSGAQQVLVSVVDMHGYSDYLQLQKAENLLNDERDLL